MSLYGEAIVAIRSVILIDERVQGIMAKVDRLTDEVRGMKERLIRLETLVELARGDGSVLRIAARRERGPEGEGGV